MINRTQTENSIFLINQQSWMVQNGEATVMLRFNAMIPGEGRGEHGLSCESGELSVDTWHLLQVQQFKKGFKI